MWAAVERTRLVSDSLSETEPVPDFDQKRPSNISNHFLSLSAADHKVVEGLSPESACSTAPHCLSKTPQISRQSRKQPRQASAVKKTRHIHDSQGQIMASALRQKSMKAFKELTLKGFEDFCLGAETTIWPCLRQKS